MTKWLHRSLHHLFMCGYRTYGTGTGYIVNGRFHEAKFEQYYCNCRVFDD